MTWFKVDDSFYDHPKVFDAPDCAVALWARAGTWSARNLTNGFVPTGMPARLCDDHDTAVKELLRRGLWSRTRSGYQFHDWDQYQPTAEQVEQLRTKRAEAGRRGGLARSSSSKRQASASTDWASKPDLLADLLPGTGPEAGTNDDRADSTRAAETSADVALAKQDASNSQASASPVAKQNAAPTRPDPIVVQEGDLPQGGKPPDSEPPRRCPDHTDDPDPPPCGGCADARRRWERWDLHRRHTDQAQRSTEARAAAEARQTAINRCHLCDNRGYLPSAAVCKHDPRRLDAARRGAAAARAALTANQPEPEQETTHDP